MSETQMKNLSNRPSNRKRHIHRYSLPKQCPDCGGNVVLTRNSKIYGRSYGSGWCYYCTGCGARVGTHPGTKLPLGRLSNAECRALKQDCHRLFDRLWKTGRERQAAYRWLARKMNLPVSQCHFGWFDKAQLLRAKQILTQRSGRQGYKKREGRRCVHESGKRSFYQNCRKTSVGNR